MGDWAALDAARIWHPYTQHQTAPPLLEVTRARGAWLYLRDGTRVLDAISSWWVNLHGHGHPVLARTLARQARHLDHVLFAGATHEPAVRLADTLLAALEARGTRLARAFYSDDGSTAVEVALKMAWQWHVHRGRPRTRFLALEGAYHGDTLGAMAVGAHSGLHDPFAPLMAPVDFVPPARPAVLEQLLDAHPDTYAACIVEPMIQGTAGMRTYPAAALQTIARTCRQHDVPLVVDEIFTGFYRTGPCFAFEHAGIEPDFLCVSKGLTGGVLPLALTFATAPAFAAFLSDDRRRAFLHGHSYTANPVACAVALASWDLLHQPGAQEQRDRLARRTRQHIEHLSHKAGVVARSLGTIGAVEITGEAGYFSNLSPRLYQAALRRGVLLRPLGPVLYCVPPYCMTGPELDRAYRVMEECLEEVAR